MNPVVTTSFQLSYVFISFAISVLGSFVALTAARRIRERNGRISLFNAGAAGLALGGVGVWAMHFIGMLALKLDVASSYSMVETAISLLAAVLATSAALAFVAKAPDHLPRLLFAGFLLGLGVVVMHYLGMFGMRIGGYIRWDYGIVALSAVIAIVAATAALWLAFNTATLRLRLAAAVLMGIAVCAMHYTGMTAAEFVCTTDNRNVPPQGFGYVSSMDLYAVVAFATLGMAALISIDQMFQWAGSQRSRAASRVGAR
ncbi:MAG: MHYT domain-containing protein [Ramlibacter sp.]